MEKGKKKSLFSDRKFRYGSLALGLTVLFVALVIVFNAVVYALTYSYGWYLDLTGQQYYGITDASEELLDNVLTEDIQIKIIFCQDKDRVLEDSAGYYVYKCAESYKKAYPNNIKVEFLDINAHPEIAQEYITQLGKAIYTYNVLIETNQSPNVRVVEYNDFFTFDSDTQNVYAFNGERRFTSYIISVCSDYPICYFTEGQGETITDGQGNPCALYDMMTDAGFDVRKIDLSSADATLDDAKVVIINNPVYDFDLDELQKLGRFMADKGGNMMVFISPDNTKGLVQLRNWLLEWGIELQEGVVKDTSHSLTPDGLSVVGDYPTEGFAASLHLYLRQLDSQPKTVVNNALSITCPWDNWAKGDRQVGSVLYTYGSASLGDLKNKQMCIAALVRSTKYDTPTESQLDSYMFVSSAGYADAEYLNSNAYGNKDILYMLAVQMGKELVPLGIEFKVFAGEELDITTAEAYTWTIVLTAVLPVAVLTVGGVICYRRKRR